jgi:hypothetical protein
MDFVVMELCLEGSCRYGGLEVMQAWSRRGVEAWRCGGCGVLGVMQACRKGVCRRGRVERDSKLWRRSKGLEEVRGSGRGRRLRRQHNTKLWRWQEALEVVEGSEAASTKLWRRLKALEGEVRPRSKALEEVRGSGGGRRLRRQHSTKL